MEFISPLKNPNNIICSLQQGFFPNLKLTKLLTMHLFAADIIDYTSIHLVGDLVAEKLSFFAIIAREFQI